MAKAFDNNVQYLLQTEDNLRPVPTNKKKSECTPLEWAQKLTYQKLYYSSHTQEWDVYRRRWECKVK